jgi:hypothetical protein
VRGEAEAAGVWGVVGVMQRSTRNTVENNLRSKADKLPKQRCSKRLPIGLVNCYLLKPDAPNQTN